MSNYPNVAAEAGDQYLAMLAQGQDQFVEFVRSSREMIPQMPKMPKVQGMPEGFAPTMPSPQQIADAQFSFFTKLLKQQEGFMRKLYNIPANSGAKSAAPKRAASKAGTTARRSKRKTKTSS
jgi:hypothetical protein